MFTRSIIVLTAVLHLLRPVVTLLLRHGVAYPAFAAGMKNLFVEVAEEELRTNSKEPSNSAVSLLAGVHRHDMRRRERRSPAPESLALAQDALNKASEVVALWLSHPQFITKQGEPKALPVSGRFAVGKEPTFDALVSKVSTDIRARTMLNELLRLGLVVEEVHSVRLIERSFVPRQGFAEMAALMRDNVHDHLAAACSNLDSNQNFLEQSLYVDAISPQAAQQLHAIAAQAWRKAFAEVMLDAQRIHEHEQQAENVTSKPHRIRFGSYFYIHRSESG